MIRYTIAHAGTTDPRMLTMVEVKICAIVAVANRGELKSQS